MYKVIITRLRSVLIAALCRDGNIISVNISGENSSPAVGSIYLGKVRDVRRPMGAAFIELSAGFTGYLNLSDKCFDELKVAGGRSLRPGDEFPVQVIKEGVGEKMPAVSALLTIPGRYVVATEKPGTVAVSSRISSEKSRKALKELLKSISDESGCGFVARTNCEGVDPEVITAEAGRLVRQLAKLRADSIHRTAHSCLYEPTPECLAFVRDLPEGVEAEVVTDIPEIADRLADGGEPPCAVRLYSDPSVSLSTLYRIESCLQKLTQKKVWLDSGAYIVIDQTEAMVCIDVNFGKSEHAKDEEQSSFRINCEAAREIARQLRLRNLAGIIVVDFINMRNPDNYEKLREVIKEAGADDPCRLLFVDFTKLGLAELTRKKIQLPVVEQLRRSGLLEHT